MIYVLTGLPGAGKTRLALALASALADRGRPALVLHTDVLKVTLRAAGIALDGPGWVDTVAKQAIVRPWLAAQAEKAARDGYELVIEGTLAIGFAPEGARTIRLDVDPAERHRRIAAKHPSARRSLASADLTGYARLLHELPPGALVLDGGRPLPTLIERILGPAAVDPA